MYDFIGIKRFRQFAAFELSGLTRVNLLVGRNNAGKTSLLEAVEMLALGGRTSSLLRSARRRGEVASGTSEERVVRMELDVRHLFLGHMLEAGLSFEVLARSGKVETVVRCEVQHAPRDEAQLELVPETMDLEPQLALCLRGPETPEGILLPVSAGGTLLSDPSRRVQPAALQGSAPVVFLGTEGAPAESLQQIWDSFVLTSEEEKVTAAMRIIEPSIERLAFTSRETRGASVAFVKLAGKDQRVPLGSLGDGTRRLLAQAIFLARAAGGVLLVDEIDTGLHYTTLESMWRFVVEAARRLDVQIFATSHSGDCIRALAWLQSEDPALASEVSVHRVEKGAVAAVPYTAAEIETAARHHIEVRG
jgi:putative AbiEii toxin of type IV toxin-antitoxin system/AAA domain-containing protein